MRESCVFEPCMRGHEEQFRGMHISGIPRTAHFQSLVRESDALIQILDGACFLEKPQMGNS